MEKGAGRGRLWFIVFTLFVASLYYFLAPRGVKLLDEQEVPTGRTTLGMFWIVISNEEAGIRFSNRYKFNLPENDFSKYNLLVSDGRRILKLDYRLISKYLWRYHFPRGKEVFDNRHYPHSMFVYRIRKIYIKQEGD